MLIKCGILPYGPLIHTAVCIEPAWIIFCNIFPFHGALCLLFWKKDAVEALPSETICSILIHVSLSSSGNPNVHKGPVTSIIVSFAGKPMWYWFHSHNLMGYFFSLRFIAEACSDLRE